MIPLDAPSRPPVSRRRRRRATSRARLYATVEGICRSSARTATPIRNGSPTTRRSRTRRRCSSRPIITCSACSTARASRSRTSAFRARDGGPRRAGRAQDLAHVRGALPPVSRHADADLARPRVRDGVRHRRAADARIRRPHASTASTSASRSPSSARARCSSASTSRCIATTESPLDPLAHHAKIRASGWKGRVVTAYRPDPVVDPEFDGFRRQRRAARRARPARTRRRGAAISPRIASAARSSRRWARRRPITAIPTAQTCDLDAARMPAAARPRACAARSPPTEAEAVPRPDADRDGAHEPRRRPGDADPSGQRCATTIRRCSRDFGRDKGADIPTRTDYVRALKPLLDRFGNERKLTVILFTLDETTLCARARAARRPLSGAASSARRGGSTTAPKACCASASR